MMLEPSIDSLMEKIDSKYMLVSLSAKRARELQRTETERGEEWESRKYVGRALKEIIAGDLTYTFDDSKELYRG